MEAGVPLVEVVSTSSGYKFLGLLVVTQKLMKYNHHHN